jgi:hypothetical protein
VAALFKAVLQGTRKLFITTKGMARKQERESEKQREKDRKGTMRKENWKANRT